MMPFCEKLVHLLDADELDAKFADGVLPGCFCKLIYGQSQLLHELIGDEHGVQGIPLVRPHRDAENTCQVQKGNVRVGLEQLAVALAAQCLQDDALQDVLTGHLRQDGEVLKIA